ncbi:WD40 repeat [Pyrenophora tritici-repentis]|uniref:Pre-rRNA-processing protein IPI3 n=2 Tax=Pyrenophora tritici-repentis TaxID=45151 RepID=A0A2W1GGZ0_9PLEO|nr:WD domain containing protein [Pyrenophora tritici-repentis Pt-1C-BFP]KAA8614664.1 WD domain-containing protein [Pyrenophora tritici-repentis]EDU50023.1 WD domain containing protein [Pyrenophora tritici-repentis Pt-1C-BFP]KAF7444493.1 WD domain containing protein [Pyrenophora tritici-repentis]KAF7564853.1 WD40 repeat protein [Pyrenophora tritici-repentis]KAG9378733.1 WD domain containing protein [Pyrenophora tritici-repentis]
MLTEQFVAAISASTKPNTGVTKDAGIFIHEFQPLVAQRQVFKKSATAPNGVAVSSSHIFAAQSEKAIVHVYSREKGNQEALVPFPERIHSIALAAQDSVLLLGTESGRILAWEICSGRLVSTSTSHLQPVTCIVVDPSSNFFLSGSSDAMIHVWALPSILSFSPDASRSPLHTLSTHRGPISSIACGHSWSSANIAVSISGDKSAIVWDYHNGQALRTYLLQEAPTAVTLDPADRAFYVAYADGSLQTIDFYDEVQKHTLLDLLRDSASSHRPIQPSPKTRFSADSQKLGGALSLSLSWDGTTLLSGHASGKIATWDIAKANYLSTPANLPGPVSNLRFLPPVGFPNTREPTFKIQTIVKPKQDAGMTSSGNGLIPPNYTLNMQLTGRLHIPHLSATENKSTRKSAFKEALTHPCFPTDMLEESLAELDSWNAQNKGGSAPAADFMALDEDSTSGSISAGDAQQAEVKELKKQLASLQRIQKVTFSQLAELRQEKDYFVRQAKKRADRAKVRAKNNMGLAHNGANDSHAGGDVEMNDCTDATSESESDDIDAADES